MGANGGAAVLGGEIILSNASCEDIVVKASFIFCHYSTNPNKKKQLTLIRSSYFFIVAKTKVKSKSNILASARDIPTYCYN